MTEFLVFNFVPVLVVECLILRLCKWGKIWTCLFDSMQMNFVSFICLMLGVAPSIQSGRLPGLLLYFIYSFLLEGFVLCLLERNSIRKAFSSAAAANFSSAILIALEAQISGLAY